MYLTKTLYLQSKPLSSYKGGVYNLARPPSPVPLNKVIRPRSPSPTRQNQTYLINYINLNELDIEDESAINWKRITPEYLLGTLGLKHDIPYRIHDIFTYEHTVVFKVSVYVMNMDLVKEKIATKIRSFYMVTLSDINVSGSYYKYFSNEEEIKSALIMANLVINDKMFRILGKNVLTLRLSLDKLNDTASIFFDSFRTVCRSEPVLWAMFIDCIDIHKVDTRKNIQSIINIYI
jgi:hypothetical protein